MSQDDDFTPEQPEDIDELREYMSDGEEDPGMPPMDTKFDSCICVDHLPAVDTAKKSKLEGVLRKIYGQLGNIKELLMPLSGESASAKSMGFAFIEFETPAEAENAIKRTQGYKLDKNHIFDVMPYSELERLQNVSEDYQEPPPPPEVRPVDNLSWLSDTLARDQFVMRHDMETVVSWAEPGQVPSTCYDGAREKAGGKHWCDLYVEWSPRGSYLCTFHRPGVALWGGEGFAKLGRMAHPEVKNVSFSPCERYMVTCNYRQGDQAALIVWNIKEQRRIRTFEMSWSSVPGAEAPLLFSWSPDGNYVARQAKDKAGGDVIQIYELPSMGLLDKKSLRAPGVREFQWSPSDNVIAYWNPEFENTPARVTLVEIPSRRELRQKNLFNVSDCRLSWQSGGDYLSVKVTRHTKSKKTTFNNFEFFRIRDNLVPVEMLEIKDRVHAMAWEPKGHRFAVVHSDGGPGGMSVSFYSMNGIPKAKGGKGDDKKELTLLKTLEQRSCTHIHWSPVGSWAVLASRGENSNGALEFYDVDLLPDKGRQSDHYRANHVEWDPSGRMVATAVLQPLDGAFYKFQMDNGFHLWTFQGEKFHEWQSEKFYQFTWRPRPPSLLGEDQKRQVIKNLRKYERKFERADKVKKRNRELARMQGKFDARAKHRALLAERRALAASLREQRVAARGGYDEEDDKNWIITEEVVEEVVDIKETIMHDL